MSGYNQIVESNCKHAESYLENPKGKKLWRKRGVSHYNNGDYKWTYLVCWGFWIEMMMILLHIGRIYYLYKKYLLDKVRESA